MQYAGHQAFEYCLMAVSFTATQLMVIPNSGIEPQAQQKGSAEAGIDPATGYEAWVFYGKDSGDAGGGTVQFNMQFPAGAYYYTLTGLFFLAALTGVDTKYSITTVVPDWEVFIGENDQMNGNVTEVLDVFDNGVSTVNTPGITGFRPRYLGRPFTATSQVRFTWPTNTNTKLYDIRLTGLRSLRPGIPWYNALQQGALL